MSEQLMNETNSMGGQRSGQRPKSRSRNMAGEFAIFLMRHKRWWLTPIILGLIVPGLQIAYTNQAISPPVYSL